MPNTKTTHVSASDSSNKKQKSVPKHASSKQEGHILKALLCVVIIFVIIFICTAIYANNYKKIYPNTYILDTKVSNMSDAEVTQYLSDTFSADKIKGASILLNCEGTDHILSVDSLNVQYDNTAAAEKVINSGKDGNFLLNTVSFLTRFFKPAVFEPVIIYDTNTLADALNKVTANHEAEPVGHTFIIGENKVTINGPVNGLKADRQIAVKEAEKQIKAMQFSSIDLVPRSIEPEALDFDVFYNWLTSEAENSYYEKIDGKIKVHPSKPKVDVDRNVVKDALDELKTLESNTIDIDVITTQPEITSQHLSEILYSNQLSTYSTNFGGSSAARANNVRLAASRINGVELMPGEEFSYDKTILPRNSKNGYMAAPVYVGNKVESGMGGGICQPSSTLYVAALYANLEILERHNHSLKVSYMPPGLDATIAEGVLDLRFKNSSAYPVKINASTDGGILTFTILGYNPDNVKVEVVRSSKNDIYYVTRVVYKNGAEVKREAMTSSKYNLPEKDEKNEKKEKEKTTKKVEKKENIQNYENAATDATDATNATDAKEVKEEKEEKVEKEEN